MLYAAAMLYACMLPPSNRPRHRTIKHSSMLKPEMTCSNLPYHESCNDTARHHAPCCMLMLVYHRSTTCCQCPQLLCHTRGHVCCNHEVNHAFPSAHAIIMLALSQFRSYANTFTSRCTLHIEHGNTLLCCCVYGKQVTHVPCAMCKCACAMCHVPCAMLRTMCRS
jgi:hypothetical protein